MSAMTPPFYISALWMFAVLSFAGVSAAGSSAFTARDCQTERILSVSEREVLFGQHLPSGAPSDGMIKVRQAYVTEYDAARRLPRWTAWYATQAFRDPPKREGRWKSFHPDPDVPDPVRHEEYRDRVHQPHGFVRGHLVPYYISGGDRNGDGKDAECSKEDQEEGNDKDCKEIEGRPVQDRYDACTVFEINYMSNVAPQYHVGFNGSGGLWYKLETVVRDSIDNSGTEFHLIAGPVFSGDPVRKIGPHSDIHVPHSFFKIVIHDGQPLAFLFTHDEEAHGPGCPLHSMLEHCIVSVDKIETATSLDFFNQMPEQDQHRIEARRNLELWKKINRWARNQ